MNRRKFIKTTGKCVFAWSTALYSESVFLNLIPELSYASQSQDKDNLPRLDWLGSGYNAFRRYAHPDDKKEQVVNIDAGKKEFNYAGRNYFYPSKYLKVGLLNERKIELIAEESILELQKKITQKASAGYESPLFFAEIREKFEKEIKSRQDL